MKRIAMALIATTSCAAFAPCAANAADDFDQVYEKQPVVATVSFQVKANRHVIRKSGEPVYVDGLRAVVGGREYFVSGRSSADAICGIFGLVPTYAGSKRRANFNELKADLQESAAKLAAAGQPVNTAFTNLPLAPVRIDEENLPAFVQNVPNTFPKDDILVGLNCTPAEASTRRR